MAGLQLDLGGSSTLGASQAAGGNAGIQFAPQGVTGTQIVIVAALVLVGFYLFTRGR